MLNQAPLLDDDDDDDDTPESTRRSSSSTVPEKPDTALPVVQPDTSDMRHVRETKKAKIQLLRRARVTIVKEFLQSEYGWERWLGHG
jgi:hypothetical protein